MGEKRSFRRRQAELAVSAAILALGIGTGPVSAASVVIHDFGGANDGIMPFSGLVADSSGALYGTTQHGGNTGGSGFGTVFKLTPPQVQGGAWTETILYNFQNGSDGAS